MQEVTLVVFSCSGREHLLSKSYQSFTENSTFSFAKSILCIDGEFDFLKATNVNTDLLVQNRNRSGYISNILNALRQIKTEYFFWEEDDFKFVQHIPIEKMLTTLQNNNNWASIFLGRTAPLTADDKSIHYFDDYYRPKFGFSVSPSLCRTAYFVEAFEAMLKFKEENQNPVYGFETFVQDYLDQRKLTFALMDPGQIPHLDHFGLLESTDREFHMIGALNNKGVTESRGYLSGLGDGNVQLSWKNKFSMVLKLFIANFKLATKLFKSREAYDFAFRIVNGYKRNFKF